MVRTWFILLFSLNAFMSTQEIKNTRYFIIYYVALVKVNILKEVFSIKHITRTMKSKWTQENKTEK